VAGVARVGESGGKGALRVRTDLEKLAHLTAGAGVSPVLRWSSPERWREVEGEADGRDPPVSVCVWGGGSTRRPRGSAPGPFWPCPSGPSARRPHGPSQWAACAARLWAAARAVRAGDRSQADLGRVPVGRLRSSVAFLFPF